MAVPGLAWLVAAMGLLGATCHFWCTMVQVPGFIVVQVLQFVRVIK